MNATPSQVFVIKEFEKAISAALDYRPVSRISAYLVQGTLDESPYRLSENPYFSAGSKIYGQGFVFDDFDPEATPLNRLEEIRQAEPLSAERILPYIGGEEVNSDPRHLPHRFVIYLNDLDEENELDSFPSLRHIVETKVRPGRMILGNNPNNVPLKRRWWAYQAHRPDLYKRIRSHQWIVAISQVTAHFAFAVLPSNYIYAHTLNVFDISRYSLFASLQCSVHEVWTRFFASSLEDRLRYTASDCFATFPFPEPDEVLDKVGDSYVSFRSSLMTANDCGLTQTYNRFHDPNEKAQDFLWLRDLHVAMDRAVLNAYHWHDLASSVSYEFLLDSDEEDQDMDLTGLRAQPLVRKKAWRYRWPDAFRDQVLARLLELNEQRYKEEQLLVKGKSTDAKPSKESNKKPAKAKPTPLLDGLDQVELSRDERLTLLIVNSFKLITRTALDEAFIAMKYPKLRKSRLGLGDPPKSVPRTDPGRDALIGGFVAHGFLEQHPSDHQQIWKLGSIAPWLSATSAERQALEETKAIFQQSIDAGDSLASCQEGVTDAKPGLVSNV